MAQASESMVEAGREALQRHTWEAARKLLEGAEKVAQAEDGGLDGEGLRLLGKARDWCGDTLGSIDAFERAYAAFTAAGDKRRAAGVALMIRHQYNNALGDPAAARGWMQRAERLLADEPECAELGFLWRVQGRKAFREGKRDEGRRLFERAIDLGTRIGNKNVVAMNLSWLGGCLVGEGHSEEGYACMDEACAAALGGELGPYATGVVYCNAIAVYRDAGEFGIGIKWSDSASRWCKRESITGFSGICRVHRAEFMRLRGALADAEREARLATGELEVSTPTFAGEAYYEIGVVRTRIGDYAGADDAFARAHQLGREPQPGAALMLFVQGQKEAALRSLEATSFTIAEVGVLERMRYLNAIVTIACDLGQTAVAERAAKEAEEIASSHPGPGLRVLAVQSTGTVQLSKRESAAHETLHRALKEWLSINAPFEAAEVRLLLARAHRVTGDEAGARREIDAAMAAFAALGAKPAEALATSMRNEPAAHAPTVARRTLLFSDIVGSTQLIEAIGDHAWSDLVTWLDGSLRECFASHGGEEVDHAGDGFFVAFPDSRSAVECAISIQRKLAIHRREHGFAPRIRIGVHAASVSESGGSYRGRGVHEASRIASIAGPDEILVSRDTVPYGFAVSQTREVAVKGVSSPIEVVTVEWKQASS
ncbi:MAG TPA: adenylate/guanylate cyclase domain-containing protein [Candidatus Dormibacteraeota bacterium]|nr:adenylate/guanylate cyclase domain-containing protein [Candidatus Dormibacteraeota bacterium]